ncbi:MAG: hypothetical protein U0T74_15200 [Chitinophagales bacterium]
MKTTSTLSKLSAVAIGLLLFSSCSKKEDLTPTNLDIDRKNDAQAQVINQSEINTNTVWEDKVNGVDYMISGALQINAGLIIKPGVTIMFEDGAGLQVNEEGSISAIGASGNEIYFTSKSGKRSAWKGITILSNNAKNVISYCKVEHGGATNSFGAGNIILGSGANTAEAEVSFSDITASGSDGIVISEGSKVHNFTGNNLHTNSAFPVNMHLTDAYQMSDMNQFSNNGKEFIKVSGNGENVIAKQITLAKLNESFLISGKVTAGNKFTIAAGSRVMMDANAEVVIDGASGNGAFVAIGTQSQPISISAIYNGTGIWNTIRFRSSNSNDNRIEYCNISGGGLNTGSADGMISVVNDNGGSSNIVIRNSNIMNSAAIGIYIQSANSEYNSDIISGNVFSNNVKGNVHIE